MWNKWRGLVLAVVNVFSSTVFFTQGWWVAGIIWAVVAFLCLAGFIVERVDAARSSRIDYERTERHHSIEGSSNGS